MFFDDLSIIPQLIQSSATTILAVPPETELGLKNPVEIWPDPAKKVITVEQVREVIALTQTKQVARQFFVFHQAERLREEAENALLKLLEEPKGNYHFVLLTMQPMALLATIRSRARLYCLRPRLPLEQKIAAPSKVAELARRLIVATPAQVVELANQIHQQKTDEREYALAVLSAAIEIAYKSYFAQPKSTFLSKIPPLLTAYRNIKANGNIRLQIMANLC